MRIFFVVVLMLMLIAGCGNLQRGDGFIYREEGIKYLNNNNFKAAYGSFMECYTVSESPGCLYNAAASAVLMGDMKTAVELFTVAAKYGEPNAIVQLEKMGEPVPDAGLLERNNDEEIEVRKLDGKEQHRDTRCKKYGYAPGTSEYNNCLTYMKNEGY